MTLLVRDERDIVEEHLAFHLAAGVDEVIVTDHASTDGTEEILERYAADGRVRVLRETEGPFRQREWVTRMARLAATEHGADWVINGDADEFWWPRGGSLQEVHDAGGAFKVLNPAFRMSASDTKAGPRAPALGEHTREVLAAAGYSESEIAKITGT